MESDSVDVSDELFSELITTGNDNSVNSKASPGKPVKKILACAYGIELSVPASISISTKQHQLIEKLVSDVAYILRSGVEDDDSNKNKSWYFSARGNEADTSITSPEEKGPTFKSSFSLSLSTEIERKEDSQAETAQRFSACFNCEGAHNLSECPEPRDMAKIRKNRAIFQEKSLALSASRFGKQKESKFSKYVPGTISENLREVLGLQPDELPPWIYEMRVLGYPPGYYRLLLEPVQTLSIYDDLESPSADVEKECVFEPNISNFVEYPGFNVPVPDGVSDMARRYGYPIMLAEHAKDIFLSSITEQLVRKNGKQKYSGRKRKGDFINTTDMPEAVDMELSDGEQTSSSQYRRRNSSPSVNDLEKTRQQILNELDNPPMKRRRLQFGAENTENGVASEGALNNSDVIDLGSPESPSMRNSTEGLFGTPKEIPLDEIPLSLNSELSTDCTKDTPSDEVPPSSLDSGISASTACSISVEPGSTPVHRISLNDSKPTLENFASSITPFIPKEEALPKAGCGYRMIKKILAKKMS